MSARGAELKFHLHWPRLLAALGGVGMVTFVACRFIPVNSTTVGFAYLLLVLVVAATWGFVESVVCAIAATVGFNFFFLPPVGTLTISDPQNWVALFSFLATALIASRLSARARQRALEAIEHRRDVERLYTFSRAILLIGEGEPFPRQLARKLAEVFELNAVVLYDRRTEEFHRAGPSDFDGLDEQLCDAALRGTTFTDAEGDRTITAVRLGAEPIGSLALQGARMSDGVLQGVANLVAIGLERARAQDLAHQVEAARQSEQLRTTLIDAMAHEFKTPLTSIKAATTSLRADPGQSAAMRAELVEIADEEVSHLEQLINDTVEMARLDTAQIRIEASVSDLAEVVRQEAASMHAEANGRAIEVECAGALEALSFDRRLVRLAIRQLLDNALKYSPAGGAVRVRLDWSGDDAIVEIANAGPGIPMQEQKHIFERFYRGPAAKRQVPGTGLGLSIAHSIALAHGGSLTVASEPGRTTFRLTLPGKREVNR
jgi:two-component system sensor histidine kinase KdpD